MKTTIFAAGLSLFLFAVPTFAADPVLESSIEKATPIATAPFAQPTVSAAIAAESSATTAAAPVQSDWRPARRPSVLPGLYVGSALLQAFDAYSTMKALGAGAREANPMMKSATSNPVAFIGIKAGVTAASIFAAEQMWKSHNRVGAIATMVASNGFMAWVAMHNAGVVNGLQR